MAKKTPIHFADDLLQGRIDRRAFVRSALAMGVGLPTIAMVLEACSGGEKEVKTAAPPPAPAATPAAPPPPPPLGPMEKELRIYNWSDYIAEDTVANFEKETGVKVTYDTYESNEELVSKLQAGASGYDLVCPSGYAVQVLLAIDLLQKVHRNELKNVGNVSPTFQKTAFDPTDEYTVPWQWGVTGLAYRKDKVTPAPDSWSVLLDARLAGKMTMMDDMRDAIGAFLKFRGKSLNSKDAAELAQAKTDLLAAKKNLQSFISAPVKGQLVAGDVWVAQLWNGDTAQATAEQPQVAFVVPKEGTTIWCDSMVIPKSAKNVTAAHAFLDYVLRPEVGAAISDFTGYGSPNAAATAKMAKPIPYPDAEEMKRLEYQLDLGAASQQWDQLWTEVKAG